MRRIGAAIFNADHTRLGDEMRRTQAAGIDFFHWDVFDGYFVPDQAFSARTIKALRPVSALPFEVHLATREPERFLRPLGEAGANLIFLPAESTPLLYETIFSVREEKMKVGVCLALGTSLSLLPPILPLIDAILLLGRVTGEGRRGREFNPLLLGRIAEARSMIDQGRFPVDLQAAGGLEFDNCLEACRAGANSFPLGAALFREPDMTAYLGGLREKLASVNLCQSEAPPGNVSEPALDRPRSSASLRPLNGARVLVASRSFGRNCPEVLETLEKAGCEIVRNSWAEPPREEELVSAIGTVDVLVSGTEPVTSQVMNASDRLKAICKHGVGYDNIDILAAKARGITVALAGPAVVDSVADLTLGLLLALARQIPRAYASVRSGRWDRFIGVELRDKVLGIVGLGQIGKAVCRRAVSFGMRPLGFDAVPDPGFARSWNLEYCSLPELLERADFISLHSSLNDQTRHLIGEKQLAIMKPTAYLINTARGLLIDESALFAALKKKQLAGAAVDVFASEPPGQNPLLELDNFLALPHCGGQTSEALRRLGTITAENVLRALRGEKVLYEV